MSGNGSFLSIFVDDPRWELGAIVVGIAAIIWYHDGTFGQLDASAYVAAGIALPGALAFCLAVANAATSSRLARTGMEARGRETGSYTGVSEPQFVAARQEIEDLIDLSKHYEIEAETVEKRS